VISKEKEKKKKKKKRKRRDKQLYLSMLNSKYMYLRVEREVFSGWAAHTPEGGN
jgi:hypothetical protein